MTLMMHDQFWNEQVPAKQLHELQLERLGDSAIDERIAQYEAQLASLTTKLREAEEKNQRAISK